MRQLRILLGLVMLASLPAAARSDYAQAVEQILSWDSPGFGHDPFYWPSRLAADSAGNVFVITSWKRGVHKVGASGAITQILSAAENQAADVWVEDVAVDSGGNAYVALGDGVVRIAPSGAITQIIDASGDGAGHPLTQATRLAVDGAGNVYVAGAQSNNVFRVTPSGTVTQLLDESGDGAGNPMPPFSDLAVTADGQLYVAAGYSIFKIDPAGSVTEFLDLESARASLPYLLFWGGVTQVALDAAENVYFLTGVSEEIVRVSQSGAATLLSGPWQEQSPLLWNAYRLEVDAAGNAYALGLDSENVVKINPSAAISEVLTICGDGLGHSLAGPEELSVGPNGNIYVSGERSGNLFRITPSGAVSEITGAPMRFYVASGIAADEGGNAYVADAGSDNVFKVTPSGEISTIIDACGDRAGNLLNGPHVVKPDRNGNVYVGGNWGIAADHLWIENIFRVGPSGSISRIVGATAGDSVTLMEVGPSGDIYVAQRLAGDRRLLKITPAGETRELVDASIYGEGHPANHPSEVVVDAEGNTFVAAESSVFKIDPSGAITEIIDASGDGDGNAMDSPRELSVDSRGNLYVLDSRKVFKVTPSGLIAKTTDLGGFLPVAALDSNGDVFASADDDLYLITPPGIRTKILEDVGMRSSVGNSIAIGDDGNLYVGTVDPFPRALKITLPPTCADGRDNDGDALVDFPEDPGCAAADQGGEDPECNDGRDNDGDGRVDHPADGGCWNAAAPSESPICDDGIDNDGDGFCDMPTSSCRDGSTPGDADCLVAWDDSEAAFVCGLGFELALLLPALMWLRRRAGRPSAHRS